MGRFSCVLRSSRDEWTTSCGGVDRRTAAQYRVPRRAYADDEHDQFVWAVEHDGDFDTAEKEYVASPERAEAFATNPNVVTGTVISKVRSFEV